MKKIFRLGTRMSLLAQAQSGWVADQLKQKLPESEIELVGITTKGDRIQDIPLSEVNGKEFFVAEIDEALLTGKIDFAVHSFKDLSLDRPSNICLAATPPREDPRDIIIFSPHIKGRLSSGEIKIGTSSPRRLEHTPPFLKKALPQSDSNQPTHIDWVPIRGNVNTRLSRIHEPTSSERYLDGVVLALSGLIRLWRDPAGRKILNQLFDKTKYMVLPLTHCPTAPAQGVLAVECRNDDAVTKQFLKQIHHPTTLQQAKRERKVLHDIGGGCHSPLGTTEILHPALGTVHFKKLEKTDEEGATINWNIPAPLCSKEQLPFVCDGSKFRAAKTPLPVEDFKEKSTRSLFISHSYAIENIAKADITDAKLWAAGTQSWFKIAKKGLWVSGCAESLGFEHIQELIKQPVLRNDQLSNWTFLTHKQAIPTWQGFNNVIASYQVEYEITEDDKEQLKNAKFIYWNSGSQFDAFAHLMGEEIHHACGAGKSFNYLREKNLSKLTSFPNHKEWIKWINDTP